MQIDPKDVLPIKELLKDSGIPVAEGQVEKIVDMVNQLLQYSDDLEKETEARLGPQAWAQLKAEKEEATARFNKELAEKLQKILDSVEADDKL